jgi:lactate dehydrogenase-like 2-hydroxyacid dehydrogenase
VAAAIHGDMVMLSRDTSTANYCRRGPECRLSFTAAWRLPTVVSVASVLPHRCVVIGAGVLGAAVAARLANAGMRVTLLDQDRPGRAASRWSFAWLNSNDKGPRPYHDIYHAGMLAWAELAPGLVGAAWYRPVGN